MGYLVRRGVEGDNAYIGRTKRGATGFSSRFFVFTCVDWPAMAHSLKLGTCDVIDVNRT